ncbi:hypothetical protein GCM10009775_04840 [Microbacterium aoyamense]|uniref:DUF1127 domain-containing protein n=1 Tax=Microbacterium aoyamense TaxID=344166 RepID=A0ABN2P8N8_9MICO|nr:hypothetical protein [Microbacterium aoyamense]
MAIGFSRTKQDFDQRAGSIALQLRDTLAHATRFRALLDTMTEQDLINLGYDASEVAILKSAFTDLDNLGKIANGQSTQAQANDFFFWAKQLVGVN